jgi:hypothetical protein
MVNFVFGQFYLVLAPSSVSSLLLFKGLITGSNSYFDDLSGKRVVIWEGYPDLLGPLGVKKSILLRW